MTQQVDPSDLKRFFSAQNQQYRRCLHPSMTCQRPAIRAHSIQNARILDLLQDNGHVIMPRHRFVRDTGPTVEFARVGRNNASTFTGLCAEHDAEIFDALDTRPFDPSDQEQCLLLALRAILREFHACVEGALRMQTGYLDRVKKGLDRADLPSPSGVFAVSQMMKSWRVYRYLCQHFYTPMAEGKSPPMEHQIIFLALQRPVLAASTFFDVDFNNEDDIVGPTLNILPVDRDQTVSVLSYPINQRSPIRTALDRFLSSSGEFQKYELSKLLLCQVENFVLSPIVYNSWSGDKKRRVLDVFTTTLFEPKPFEEHVDLMLF